MTNSHVSRSLRRLLIFCTGFAVLAILPLLSSAQPATSVNIVNGSTREIRNVYLSHVGSDDWSGNQLGNSTIAPGQSRTLADIACDQQQVKVIAEDEDGCFLSTIVTCNDNAVWTITSTTPRDCGGN